MTDKKTTERRSVLKTLAVATASGTGIVATGRVSGETSRYYAEYRDQKHGSFKQGLSKLQIRVEYDVEGGTISSTDVDITARAGAYETSFKGIATKEKSGGAGETYFTIYVEGNYHDAPNEDYVHWLRLTVRADQSHSASSKWKTEFVGAGEL